MSESIKQRTQALSVSKDAREHKKLLDAIRTEFVALRALANELRTDHATQITSHDELISTMNELITQLGRDQVIPTGTAMTLAVDASAEDIQTSNAIVIQNKGERFNVAATAAFDISASGTCAGDTVATSKSGAGWVFADSGGTYNIETDIAAQTHASAIVALAQYSIATNTLPPASDDVCVGCVQVTEGGSGEWTWGTDSISGESETFYDIYGLPIVNTALASFALDADAATYTYGTANVRLGSGTIVAATGKANAVLQAGTVATAKTGAWLFYILADDSEVAVPLGIAYADLATAQAAVRDHTPNPLLPLVGVIYVVNASGANFVGGTTKFDKTGITSTFTKVGPGANHLEIGRAALNQPNQVLQNAGPATIAAAATTESLAA